MGAPFPVMQGYVGFMSDVPRHELPPGVLWDMVNLIPDLDGAMRRRNGFGSLGSLDYSAIPGSAGVGYTGAFVAYCPFGSVAHEVLAVDQHGEAFSFQEPSFTGSYLTLLPFGQCNSRGVWLKDTMMLLKAGSDAAFYTGRAGGFVAAGTTPKGGYGTAWGDYAIQANDGGSNRQRLWFSNPGNPKNYDLTNSWQDIPGVVKGVEGIRGAILVWTDNALYRITGDTPPSSGILGNLTLRKMYDVGLVDERSIAQYGGWVIFANAEGVWMTDGASAPKCLTVLGGINQYWRSIMSGYSLAATDYVVSGGVYRGYYVVAVTSSANSVKVTLVCDLSTNRWFRLDYSFPACMMAHAVSGHEDLFLASTFNGRILSTASAWETASSTDYDGESVLASWETPIFRGFQRYHRRWIPSNAPSVFQRAYLNYDAPGGGSNAFQVGYTTSPESGAAYTTIGSFKTTSAPGRSRLGINPNGGAVAARGIGFKFWQDALHNSTSLRVNDMELEYFTREGSR